MCCKSDPSNPRRSSRKREKAVAILMILLVIFGIGAVLTVVFSIPYIMPSDTNEYQKTSCYVNQVGVLTSTDCSQCVMICTQNCTKFRYTVDFNLTYIYNYQQNLTMSSI